MLVCRRGLDIDLYRLDLLIGEVYDPHSSVGNLDVCLRVPERVDDRIGLNAVFLSRIGDDLEIQAVRVAGVIDEERFLFEHIGVLESAIRGFRVGVSRGSRELSRSPEGVLALIGSKVGR